MAHKAQPNDGLKRDILDHLMASLDFPKGMDGAKHNTNNTTYQHAANTACTAVRSHSEE